MALSFLRTQSSFRSLPMRYRPDGRRFGPKLAPDGGRILASSSRDLLKLVQKKRWTDEQVKDLAQKGVLHKWLAEPRQRKKIVLHDGVSGWEKWTSKRVPLMGKKLGMRREVDMWGNIFAVTLVQLQENVVLSVKTGSAHQKETEDEYITLQMGAGLRKWKNLTRAEMGQFAKLDTDPKEIVKEFQVTKDAVIPAGTKILPTHFVVGQYVDIKGRSKGHGTTGVMKRHGFKGAVSSHGTSKTHRAGGSIASGAEYPARVFPGTKMAGRMGNDSVTVFNLQILKINVEDQILTIKGHIPGPKGAWVTVRDAVKKPHRLPPPFPTHLPDVQTNRPLSKKKYIRMRFPDPYQNERTFDWDTRWAEARIALKSAQQAAGGLLEGEEDGDGGDDLM
eukprot:TRINITY_DN11451_c0_g1_i1.p1 TRINITY_DN11451_c0_g1~~TRINITY_DN11451_c0_g1_i1.p1  ORF type:complete len:391 (-),score=89.85 TRINITY_DN11451_c0_g1_i1:81-1253(-)